MTYQPQPGTIPHRVIAWLKAMEKAQPGKRVEVSSADLAEAMGVADSRDIHYYLRRARDAGAVVTKGSIRMGHHVVLWSLGDGTPVPKPHDYEPDRPLHASGFRALDFEGRLLVTGMEIRDGVAIFTREQVLRLRAQTDWWVAA